MSEMELVIRLNGESIFKGKSIDSLESQREQTQNYENTGLIKERIKGVLLDHTTHHRAQAVRDLRYNGVTPLRYRYF